MTKIHGGSGKPQGTLNKGGPKPRVYANHGGTNLQQGKVHDGVQPRQYGFHGGTNLVMGALNKGKRKT
jgi:hypothetical protein